MSRDESLKAEGETTLMAFLDANPDVRRLKETYLPDDHLTWDYEEDTIRYSNPDGGEAVHSVVVFCLSGAGVDPIPLIFLDPRVAYAYNRIGAIRAVRDAIESLSKTVMNGDVANADRLMKFIKINAEDFEMTPQELTIDIHTEPKKNLVLR